MCDGDVNEVGAVVGDGPFHALGEIALQILHLGAHVLRGLQSVAGRGELDANTHGRFAIQAGRCGIGLATQFDARHVFQTDGGAIGVGAQHDVTELLHGGELAIDHHGGGDALPRHVGQIANGAAGDLRVLRADGCRDICRRELVTRQPCGLNPDAHGAFGAEQLCLPDARQALELGHDVARTVVAQCDGIKRRVLRGQHGKQQKVRA